MSTPLPSPAFVRSYRRTSRYPDERSFQVVVEQTDLWITVRDDPAQDFPALTLEAVSGLRAALTSWILLHPGFAESLAPLDVPAHAPEIVRRMAGAAYKTGVGPMAAVAGTMAAMVAETLHAFSSEVIVENGGDSMLFSTRERVVALLSDRAGGLGLGCRLAPDAFPVSFCASSGRLGHSLSFGRADLVAVRAADASLADAAATALANALKKPEDAGAVAALAEGLGPQGVDGAFVVCGDALAVWGAVELVAV